MQTTVSEPIVFKGIGLHTGKKSTLTLQQADADFGICFKRTDILSGDNIVQASWLNIANSELCTRLMNSQGVSVLTVEHLMAGLAGCGINNALVEINGPEVPILDGSAVTFVKEILKTGIKLQNLSLIHI